MKEKKEEEIDLIELFLKGINIVRANFWLITSFFFLGTALGFVHYYTAKKVYENKMVISSAILTKSYGQVLIDNINRHRREYNIASIASQLNISEQAAKEIGYIKIESLAITDETKESDRFIITVDVFDQEMLPALQQGLIYHFENNEFVKIRVEQNKNSFRQLLAKVEQEIKDMEEFKTRIFNGTFFQTIKGNVMFDPTTVNSKIIELTKEKLTLQNNLELVNSVQLIEGFNKFERPTQPKLSVSLISGSFIGLIFVGLLIFFKSIRKLLTLADEVKKTTA